MHKGEILDIIEGYTHNVVIDHTTAVNINNSGTLNEEKLLKEKKAILKHSVEYLADELIKARQHYPIGDISEVDLTGEFIILKRKDFNLLKMFIENLNE